MFMIVNGSDVNGSNASAQNFIYAGFWIRAVALVIDHVLILFLVEIARRIMIPFVHSGALLGEISGSVLVAIPWLYHGLFESSSWQATVGKKALSLQVVSLRGHRLGFFQAMARWFLKMLSSVPSLGLCCAVAALTERKQAWHDIFGRTLVVYKPKLID